MRKQQPDNPFAALGGIVFSTDPDYKPEQEEAETPAVDPARQVLRLWLERGKGGKESTIVKGYSGPQSELDALAKTLKNKCAAGGNAKDGIIVVQGDHRDKIMKLLIDMGFTNTKKAGG